MLRDVPAASAHPSADAAAVYAHQQEAVQDQPWQSAPGDEEAEAKDVDASAANAPTRPQLENENQNCAAGIQRLPAEIPTRARNLSRDPEA